MAPVRLENEALVVVVAPHYGARITSLVDKATGRDWIAPGGESAATGEAAVYLAEEAVGWDECFPTVAPWDATGTGWARMLRDHGDLWGRPWRIDAQAATALTTSYATDNFAFSRTLELQGNMLRADYSVRNRGSRPLPYMWALHGLLAVTPEDRIELPGVSGVTATYLSHRGGTLIAPQLSWPGPDEVLGLSLDRVYPADEHFAGKLYASGIATASVGSARGRLDLAWTGAGLNQVGLWLNYGGWPGPGATHHIAIEPTTAPVDHLGLGIENGTARTLAPGATHGWSVTLTCRHATSS